MRPPRLLPALVVTALLAATLVARAEPRSGRRGRQRSRVSRARLGRRAAIDFGSSSAKLVILSGSGKVLVNLKQGIALAKGIGPDNLLPKANQQRGFNAVKRFVGIAERYGVPASEIRFFATAATRNANGAVNAMARAEGKKTGRQFVEQDLRGTLGLLQATILSGKQEARVGYRGAISGWTRARASQVLGHDVGKLLVIDQGGGSHQVMVGDWSGPAQLGSTQVGSVRAHELTHGSSFKADKKRLKKADKAMAKLVPSLPIDASHVAGATPLLTGGLAGLLRIHIGKDVITRGEIEKLRVTLAKAGKKQRRRLLTHRADGTPLPRSDLRLLDMYRTGKRGPKGTKAPAKITLLLRLLDLGGVTAKDAKILLSTTGARHVVAAEGL